MVIVPGAVHVVHAGAMMMPRVGCIAGDCESRCRGGETQDAITKPAAGFRTHPNHYAPRPRTPRRASVEARPCLRIWDAASSRCWSRLAAAQPVREAKSPTKLGRHPDDTVKHARRSRLRKG